MVLGKVTVKDRKEWFEGEICGKKELFIKEQRWQYVKSYGWIFIKYGVNEFLCK